MAWVLLIIAGLLETGWAIGLKYTEGFTRLVPSVLTILAIIVSMGLLGVAARHLDRPRSPSEHVKFVAGIEPGLVEAGIIMAGRGRASCDDGCRRSRGVVRRRGGGSQTRRWESLRLGDLLR